MKNTTNNYKHGEASNVSNSVTAEYRTWLAMKRRCENPNCKDWPNYGGRGIFVCDRWQVYENFITDMGRRPDGKSIDRKDVNGHYEPGNCRWADVVEQANNKRSTSRSEVSEAP